MRKIRVFLLLWALCWFSGQGILYAQYDDDDAADGGYPESGYPEPGDPESGDGIPWESDWDGYISDLYSRGDQTFTMSLGVIFPVAFVNGGKAIEHHFNPPVGGTLGPMAYTYFLSSNLFIGAEAAFLFNYTLGQNTIFMIPIGVHAGWQFLISRFEVPLSITAGMVPHRYLNYAYLGFFLKGGASAYFRFSPDWSFGLNTNWTWYPQWPKVDGKRAPDQDVSAHILGITLCARYHF